MIRIFIPLIFLCQFGISLQAYSQRSLPKPIGTYPVGTRIFELIDASRSDSLLGDKRHILIQAWYPCKKTDKLELMNYIPETKLIDYVLANGYYGLDSADIRQFYSLKTNSYKNAPIINSHAVKFPVLFFSVGLGTLRANYTSIYQNLASQGIIVLTVEHLYAGEALFENGKIIDAGMYPKAEADPHFVHVRDEGVMDLTFILNEMFTARKGQLKNFLKNAIDKNRIGASGHSFGGNLAMAATMTDKRIKFSINLDGGDFTGMENKILSAPSMIMREQPAYTDEELVKKGRDPVAWKANGEKSLDSYKNILSVSGADGYLVRINQTGHFSFSDAPYLMPFMLTRFLGTYLTPDRNLEVITTLMLTFIQNFDSKQCPTVLKNESEKFKEVTFYSFDKP